MTSFVGGSYAAGENMRRILAAVLVVGAAGLAGVFCPACEVGGCTDDTRCAPTQEEANRLNAESGCENYIACDTTVDTSTGGDAGESDTGTDREAEHGDASVDVMDDDSPLDGDAGRPPTGYPEGGSPLPGSGFCDPFTPCPADQFCFYMTVKENCGAPSPGVIAGSACDKRPSECTSDCPKVCGCDGKWYCNECEANAAGVSIGPEGHCPADGGVEPSEVSDGGQPTGYPDGGGPPWTLGPPPCITEPGNVHECPADKWCYDIEHNCGYNLGGCAQRPAPSMCTDDCPGVCGCDKHAYCNECKANAAGVDVYRYGPCPDGGP
jgi:hypothetical protein